MQADESATKPQLVANAFVQQYYAFLTQSPAMVHRFYQDISTIGRPSLDGSMSIATTLTGIDAMIISQDYKNCSFQILNADAQDSFGNGVIVLVTGFFTGKDIIKRKFSQLFFLALQETGGYFVLNDIFRYFDDEEVAIVSEIEAGETAPSAPVTSDHEPTAISNNSLPEHLPFVHADEHAKQVSENSHPVENGEVLAAEKELVVNHTVEAGHSADTAVSVGAPQNGSHTVPESAASSIQEDAPKKSYASVASALNLKKQPFQQRGPPGKPVATKPIAVKPVEEAHAPVASATLNTSPSSNTAEKNSNTAKGYSIFVANLPMDATVEQLIQVFEQFGPIKPNGVQVRSYKQEKNCFGFVEFESADAMQSALQVSTIMIGNRKAHIEEKKAASNDGGKYPPRRGEFRNDSFRGRGNSGGGRSFGRNESDNQGGFFSQTRGASRHNEEDNHKVHRNGGAKAGRQGRAQSEEI